MSRNGGSRERKERRREEEEREKEEERQGRGAGRYARFHLLSFTEAKRPFSVAEADSRGAGPQGADPASARTCSA